MYRYEVYARKRRWKKGKWNKVKYDKFFTKYVYPVYEVDDLLEDEMMKKFFGIGWKDVIGDKLQKYDKDYRKDVSKSNYIRGLVKCVIKEYKEILKEKLMLGITYNFSVKERVRMSLQIRGFERQGWRGKTDRMLTHEPEDISKKPFDRSTMNTTYNIVASTYGKLNRIMPDELLFVKCDLSIKRRIKRNVTQYGMVYEKS